MHRVNLIPYLGTPQASGFIIHSNGDPLSERQYRIRWARVFRELQKLGFNEVFTAHQLRHTNATIAANSGSIPLKVLQGMMGHANFQTTMNTYADFDTQKTCEYSKNLGTEYAKITEKVAENLQSRMP